MERLQSTPRADQRCAARVLPMCSARLCSEAKMVSLFGVVRLQLDAVALLDEQRDFQHVQGVQVEPAAEQRRPKIHLAGIDVLEMQTLDHQHGEISRRHCGLAQTLAHDADSWALMPRVRFWIQPL